jgi:hypothetical protein
VVDHRPAGGDEDEEERAVELREQTLRLVAGIPEVDERLEVLRSDPLPQQRLDLLEPSGQAARLRLSGPCCTSRGSSPARVCHRTATAL